MSVSIQGILQQGDTLLAQGQVEAALKKYRQAFLAAPHGAEVHERLGQAFYRLGDLVMAKAHYEQACALAPQEVSPRLGLGELYLHQHNWQAAIALYRHCLNLASETREALAILCNLGVALYRSGDLPAALVCLQQAAQRYPDSFEVHLNLGAVLQDPAHPTRLALSAHHYRRALALQPQSFEALTNLALVCMDQGDPMAAIDYSLKALEIRPDCPTAHANLGIAYADLAQLESAIAHYRRSLALQPENADVHYNLSLALLLAGDLEQGLVEYEWRSRTSCSRYPTPDLPAWDGSPLGDRTLLLLTEGGLGDMIQLIRYVPQLAAYSDRSQPVIFPCPAALIRLFKPLKGLQVIAAESPRPEADCYAFLMSLPFLTQTRLHNIPASVPYLPAFEPISLPTRFADSFKVGIVWASGVPQRRGDIFSYKQRSCPLALMLEFLAQPGIELYSLQVGLHRSELLELPEDQVPWDMGARVQDFADTAAIIAALDWVISVDTAVAHLAGALAKPTWLLLPFVPDWRWFLHREDSPWYPTLRLFRQTTPGNWREVLERVGQSLQVQCQNHFATLLPGRFVS